MSEQKTIENKILSVKYSTLYSAAALLLAGLITSIKIYGMLMDANQVLLNRLDEINHKYEVQFVIQDGINKEVAEFKTDQKVVNTQHELRIQRIEAKVR